MADKIKYLGQEGLNMLIDNIAEVSVIEVSKAQYDALTPNEKQDRTFCINDWTPDETLGGSYNGPIGEIIAFMGTTAPNNFLVCDGSIYNISDYIDLANHINKHFGKFNFFGGDGTTTFAVPDLRGEFLRGSGTNGHEGQGSGSTVGKHQNATTHVRLEMEETNRTLRYASGAASSIDAPDSIKMSKDGGFYFSNIGTAYNYGQWGGFTSRPTNTSVLYCIRYREAGNGGSGENINLEKRFIIGSCYTEDVGISIKSTTKIKMVSCNVKLPSGKYYYTYVLPATFSTDGYQFRSDLKSGEYVSTTSFGDYAYRVSNGALNFSGTIEFGEDVNSVDIMGCVTDSRKTVTLPAYNTFPVTFIKLD